MIPADLSTIERTITVAAPLEKVWRAVATPDGLRGWFVGFLDGDFQVGGTLRMNCQGQDFSVIIEAIQPPRRFAWRWHPGAVDPAVDYSQEPMTTVSFTLEQVDGGTRVHVIETGFDRISLVRRAKLFDENSHGWDEVLVWLTNYVQKAD